MRGHKGRSAGLTLWQASGVPAKSESQRRLMAAAAHGATFTKAKQLRASMSPQQLEDYSHMEHESHTYSWRSRHNLKRGRTNS